MSRDAKITLPNVLTCPECRVVVRGMQDPEGAMCCENGHSFWDTTAPKWVVIRERDTAQTALDAAEAEVDRLRKVVSYLADPERAAAARAALSEPLDKEEG